MLEADKEVVGQHPDPEELRVGGKLAAGRPLHHEADLQEVHARDGRTQVSRVRWLSRRAKRANARRSLYIYVPFIPCCK